ncbi:hypothetical protein LTR28_007608 [Elasticomyces elasticus]|nr:hypothetical protein LTR28_007608 [Elasticomyces elasticus]
MGLLKHFRSRSHLSPSSAEPPPPLPTSSARSPLPARYGRDFTARLPEPVLLRIFAHVCPHAQDTSYEASEQSTHVSDGCGLCDLRDLAHCARVSPKWYAAAQRMLYGSVRIDAVHFCALEELLCERRMRKSFRGRNGTAPDIPTIRLQLLCRTVRDSQSLASRVLYLRLPYMTRETAKADLARTVAVLPNLRYVDLPEGFFTGDASTATLSDELQKRCPDIRKMKYQSGAESALEMLGHQRAWQNLEILELDGIAIEPTVLRLVLASLPALQELTLSNLPWLDDGIFGSAPSLPPFPTVRTLALEAVPRITSHGLLAYLSSPYVREILTALSLTQTGVAVSDLHSILWDASSLALMTIVATVSSSLALSLQSTELPPLTSVSLKVLHYEISSAEGTHGLQHHASSYYAYLATSLRSQSLPALEQLYVREPDFPELLLLGDQIPELPYADVLDPSHMSVVSQYNQNGGLKRPVLPFVDQRASVSSQYSLRAPILPFATQQDPRRASVVSQYTQEHQQQGQRFTQRLEIFSKGIDENDWVFTSISPEPVLPFHHHHHHPDRRASTASQAAALAACSPLSSSLSASRSPGPQWATAGFGGEARKSVIVGNGFSGFLAVPQEEEVPVPRPLTSGAHGHSRQGSAVSLAGLRAEERVRWGSEASEGSRAGWLRPPPSLAGSQGSGGAGKEKRGSRADLWR